MSEVVCFTGLPERIEVGAGIVVRRPTESDLPGLVAAANSTLDTLRPWMPWAQQPLTVEGQRPWLAENAEQWSAGTGFHYEIFDPADDVLGGIGYHVRNGPGVLEIGYWLRRDQEGRGLMTAVAAAMTETALRVDGVTSVEIHCDVANVRSAAIPQRLGYVLREVRSAERLAPAHTGQEQIWEFALG